MRLQIGGGSFNPLETNSYILYVFFTNILTVNKSDLGFNTHSDIGTLKIGDIGFRYWVFVYLNLHLDLIPIQFTAPNLNLYTNRPNRYTNRPFQRKLFLRKKILKFFFSNLVRFIYQNGQNQVLRNF